MSMAIDMGIDRPVRSSVTPSTLVLGSDGEGANKVEWDGSLSLMAAAKAVELR